MHVPLGSGFFVIGTGALSLPFFFFNDTATTEIYTLSLHDALPISFFTLSTSYRKCASFTAPLRLVSLTTVARSEEHTSELQSLAYLVCRLLLEKKTTIPCLNASTKAQPPTRAPQCTPMTRAMPTYA